MNAGYDKLITITAKAREIWLTLKTIDLPNKMAATNAHKCLK